MTRRRARARAGTGEDPRPTPRREKQTLIPAFDPQDLARAVEEAGSTPTVAPPFDPASYARIVDEHVTVAAAVRDTPRTLVAAEQREQGASVESTEAIGRTMYGSYLASDFPKALVLAERLLEQQPDHALAQLVAERCRAALSEARLVHPSSVLRLRSSFDELRAMGIDARSELVAEQLDGVLDAATVAELAGVPPDEAIGRLHALLDLGVLELVSA
jgi:hypothetical protein